MLKMTLKLINFINTQYVRALQLKYPICLDFDNITEMFEYVPLLQELNNNPE